MRWVPLHYARFASSKFDNIIPAYTVGVYKEGNYVVTVDGKTKEVIARSTDHAEVLRIAKNYVASKGRGTLYVRGGKYYINSSVTPKDKVKVVADVDAEFMITVPLLYLATGESVSDFVWEGGKVVDTSDTGTRWMFIRGQATRFVLRNVSFIGVSESEGVRFDKADGVLIERCYFEARGNALMAIGGSGFVVRGCTFDGDRVLGAGFISNGLYLSNVRNVLVEGNVFRGHGHNGVFSSGGGPGYIIVGNWFEDCADGIDINGVEYVTIGYNVFYNVGTGGDAAVGIESATKYVTVIGNVIYSDNANLKAIAIWGTSSEYAENVSVIGNIVNSTINLAARAIDLSRAKKVVIAGNVFRHTTPGGTMYGIKIRNDADEVLIEGNYINFIGDGGSDPWNSSKNTIRVEAGSNIYIRNNVISGAWARQPPFIAVVGGSNVRIEDNWIEDLVSVNGILPIRADVPVVIRRNTGYPTEAFGVATFSGDGATTQFKVEHGLVKAPSKVIVTPMSADAKDFSYAEADDTYIYFNFSTAPPSGTDNVKLAWTAEV